MVCFMAVIPIIPPVCVLSRRNTIRGGTTSSRVGNSVGSNNGENENEPVTVKEKEFKPEPETNRGKPNPNLNSSPSTPIFNFGTGGENGLFSIFELKMPSTGCDGENKSGRAGNNLPGGGGLNIFKFPLFNHPPPIPHSVGKIQKKGAVSGDYLHTVLYGPPGTGKTEVAKILGNIFCNLGVLKSNTFKKVTRSDLVAGYLGQTAIKTREVIESAIGGVLFIDEAYALGNTEKRDSFSKECIDTLCEALSDHKHELMVIIAGYEKELNDCFFSYNEGLSSRFTWRYKIESYDAVELRKIFEKIVKDNNWTFDERDQVKDEWFKTRHQYFKYFGRDIEVFFTKTKIAHGRRAFYLPAEDRRILTMADLDAGFELFSNTDEIKARGQQLAGPAATMYL